MDAAVTPTALPQDGKGFTSQSRTRSHTPPPRPTTPLRAPSRSSLRSSHTPVRGSVSTSTTPLTSLEPAFAELSDSMADLEANFMHLQLMHESLSRFSECFASFLYGMNVNAFCVDFPEAPIPESFRRAATDPRFAQTSHGVTNQLSAGEGSADTDQTFLTTDTSFVENPPATSGKGSVSSRFSTPAGRGSTTLTTARGARGTGIPTQGRGLTGRRGRASGLARATTRGRGASTR